MWDELFNNDDYFIYKHDYTSNNIGKDNDYCEDSISLEKEMNNFWYPRIVDEEMKKNETVKEEEKKEENKISNINILISNKTKRSSKQKKKKRNLDDENMRKDCKHILLKIIFNFINSKISEIYNDNIGQGICIKQFQSLNQKQKSELKIDFNKDFLKKTLGQILSENISPKITNFSQHHNKNLIQELLNEKDIEKKKYFNKLFNLTFLQCLEHFRETDYHEELSGMPLLKDEINNYLEDDDYIKSLQYYFSKYENIINNKRSRHRNKNNKDNNKNDSV